MGARLRWWRYWYITRRVQRVPARIAHRVPAWLKYWVYIDVVADVTTRPGFSHRIVPEVTAMEVLEAIHRG